LLKQRGEQRLVTDEEDRNEMKSWCLTYMWPLAPA
jgi:hypothetical protein